MFGAPWRLASGAQQPLGAGRAHACQNVRALPSFQTRNHVRRLALAGFFMPRQLLTLVFTDLCRSTAMGRRIEPEELSALLARVRRIWHAAAQAHGGLVARTQGDGAVIVFGHLAPGELDGLHAAEAALAIHHEVSALDAAELLPGSLRSAPLQAHSGIHAGVVLVDEGDLQRGVLDLVGDVPNTAAKLQGQAAPGEILATASALGPHAGMLQHEVLDARSPAALAVGAAGSVVRLLGRAAAVRRFDATARRGLTPLLGRQDVLQRLGRFLSGDLPDMSDARCAVLAAPAGMGKTRLLEELRAGAAATTVLSGTCELTVGAEALQPFAQMLRSLPEALRATLPAGSLAQALAEPGVERFHALLSALAQTDGLVLFFDDWQWADDASRRLLGELRSTPGRLRMLVAARPQEDGLLWLDACLQLSLRPLLAAETAQAVQRWLPDADPFLAERIHAYSGGVPLYIEELCHATSAGVLAQSLEARSAGQQGWVAMLVASRLERLPPRVAGVVRAASAIGTEAPLALLADVSGTPLDPDTLALLAEADLLHADPARQVLRFKHGITHDAVYAAVGLPERRALHRRILQGLGADGQAPAPATLAHHSWGAALWAAAIDHAEMAGDRAMQVHAVDRARAHYRMALDAGERLVAPDQEQQARACRLAHKLGMACVFDPLSIGDGMAVFERALQGALALADPALEARSLYWLGYMEYALGSYLAAQRHIREALALARQIGDGPLVTQVQAVLGQVLHATCGYDEAIGLIDVAVAAKRDRARPGSGIAVGSAYALACKGSMLADRGAFEAAWSCFDEAICLLGNSKHPVGNSVRNWYTVACIWAERWDAAERLALESVAIAEPTRALLLLAIARSTLGYTRWRRGDGAAASELMQDAVGWIASRYGRMFTSLHFGWLAEACVAQGRVAQARQLAAHVMWRARQGERLGEGIACRAMARAALQHGRPDQAARWLRRAEAAAAARQSPREQALNAVLVAELALGEAPQSTPAAPS